MSDYLFLVTENGFELGPTVYSHYYMDTNDIVLRNTRDDASFLRLTPGRIVYFDHNQIEQNTYELAKTVLLPPEAIIPKIPRPYMWPDQIPDELSKYADWYFHTDKQYIP